MKKGLITEAGSPVIAVAQYHWTETVSITYSTKENDMTELFVAVGSG